MTKDDLMTTIGHHQNRQSYSIDDRPPIEPLGVVAETVVRQNCYGLGDGPYGWVQGQRGDRIQTRSPFLEASLVESAVRSLLTTSFRRHTLETSHPRLIPPVQSDQYDGHNLRGLRADRSSPLGVGH